MQLIRIDFVFLFFLFYTATSNKRAQQTYIGKHSPLCARWKRNWSTAADADDNDGEAATDIVEQWPVRMFGVFMDKIVNSLECYCKKFTQQ